MMMALMLAGVYCGATAATLGRRGVLGEVAYY